jgi:PUA-domain protein
VLGKSRIRFLRKDEIKDLRNKIEDTLGIGDLFLPAGCSVEVFSLGREEIYVVNGEPVFYIREDETIVPLLIYVLKFNLPLPNVTVDIKAVPHVCNGADIFRPGVTQIDPSIREGQTVVVVEEKNKKPICVGRSLMDASAMQKVSGGKVILNNHYVGDNIWNFSKTLKKSRLNGEPQK